MRSLWTQTILYYVSFTPGECEVPLPVDTRISSTYSPRVLIVIVFFVVIIILMIHFVKEIHLLPFDGL